MPTPSDNDHHEIERGYRSDLLLARLSDADDDPLEGDDRVGRLEGHQLLTEKLGRGSNDHENIDALFDNRLAAYEVRTDDDPLELATQLHQQNQPHVEALDPVLLTTITPHWSFAPGDEARYSTSEPATDTLPQTLSSDDAPTAIVGVIDTGFCSGDEIPEWLREPRVVPVDAFDEEPDDAPPRVRGHGMFVASLIAQKAPSARIVLARLPSVEDGIFDDALKELAGEGHASHEVELFLAVQRLIAGIKRELALTPVPLTNVFMNLSLGSYLPTRDSAAGHAIRKAVALWKAEGYGRIIAAAGNKDPAHTGRTPPFLPAAYASETGSNVVAVGSVTKKRRISKFSNSAKVKRLGERLVGIRHDGVWSAWSGTSFATAVASGEAAGGALPTGTRVDVRPVIQD